jgi:hypothetical protein
LEEAHCFISVVFFGSNTSSISKKTMLVWLATSLILYSLCVVGRSCLSQLRGSHDSKKTKKLPLFVLNHFPYKSNLRTLSVLFFSMALHYYLCRRRYFSGPSESGQDSHLSRLPLLLFHLPALHQELGQKILQRNRDRLCKYRRQTLPLD